MSPSNYKIKEPKKQYGKVRIESKSVRS